LTCKLGSDVYLFGEIGEKTSKEENKKTNEKKGDIALEGQRGSTVEITDFIFLLGYKLSCE
jgi:hypothetical protein